MSRRAVARACLAVALLSLGGAVSAAEPGLADHPIVGAWIVSTPGGPALTVFHPDGTFVSAFPIAAAPPSGLTLQSTQIGVWEPTGDRSVHMSGVYLFADPDGAFTGSFTYDGYQSVSEDGSTVIADDGGTATFRDVDGTVLMVLPADHGVVVGTRMRVGLPGFPTGASTLADQSLTTPAPTPVASPSGSPAV